MELKEYQKTCVDEVKRYLEALATGKAEYDVLEKANRVDVVDYAYESIYRICKLKCICRPADPPARQRRASL
jgi:phosphate uptake regulator